MSTTCNTCQKPISWDTKTREGLGIRGPLNPDKSVHKCYAEMKTKDEVPPRPSAFLEPTDQQKLTRAILDLTASVNMLIAFLAASTENERNLVKAKLN